MPGHHIPACIAAAFAVALCCPGVARAEVSGVASREYKVGINRATLPPDPAAAIAAVSRRLETARPIRFGAPSHGEVWFSDTRDCALSRASLLLRSRARPGKPPRHTLKIRNPDILLVDRMPLTLANTGAAELEDDRSIGPDGQAQSNFSRSLSFEAAPLGTLADLGRHIRNLEAIVAAAPDTPLRPGPVAASTVHASEALRLAGDTSVVIEASFWYPAGGSTPLAADVSFTLEAPFAYASLVAAERLLADLANALGPLRGASGEKALAVIPEPCR